MELSGTMKAGRTHRFAAAGRLPEDPLPQGSARPDDTPTTWRGRKRLLEVELEAHPHAAVVRLHGSAGIAEAEALRLALEGLIRQGVPMIVVDLGDLQYVASIAISAVTAGICRTSACLDRIRLAAPSASVLELLRSSRVTDSLRVYPTVAAAIRPDASPADPEPPSGRQRGGPAGPSRGTGPSVRIPVASCAEESVVPVPVRQGQGGVPDRLAARGLGGSAGGAALFDVA